jgi:tartrate/fumarate subfamily iron-sulfur-dependent hydro-lyase beta chain
MTMIALQYPFTAASVQPLRVGDRVTLSGRVVTGRDRLHKFLHEGGSSPMPLRDAAMFHCGPVVLRRDGRWIVRAAGPTTSARQDAYMPDIIRGHRLRVILGKGGMGDATRRACKQYGCVYLQIVGGAAVFLAQSITGVHGVHFLSEFGMAEAMWELDVKDLPAVVAIDTHGGSLHRRVRCASRRALRAIVENGRAV